jgi:hypothetical protein
MKKQVTTERVAYHLVTLTPKQSFQIFGNQLYLLLKWQSPKVTHGLSANNVESSSSKLLSQPSVDMSTMSRQIVD